jgi:hypothetical protein
MPRPLHVPEWPARRAPTCTIQFFMKLPRLRLALLPSSFSLLPALAALAVSAFAAAPASPPLTDLVDDQTAFALVVPDAAALVKGWDASPFAKTWGDEQVVKFLTPLRQQMKIDQWDEQAKAATGKTVRELLALAKGGAIVALPASLFADAVAGKPPVAPSALLAVELGENSAAVEKLIVEANAKVGGPRAETTTYAGVAVHRRLSITPAGGGRATTPLATAMCQGIWLFSLDYERVCAAIDAIKKGGLSNALGRSEGYLRAQKRAGPAHAVFYGSFSALYPPLLAALKKQLPPAGTEGAPPFTAEGLLTGLGLDTLREFVFTVQFDAKETRVTGGLTYAEERGLVKLLAYGPGPAVRPTWASPKWFSVAADKFDLRAAYAALEEMVANISPELSSTLQDQLKAAGTEAGIDVKRDLVGSLGSDLLVAQALPPGADPAKPTTNEADTLIALSLENPAAFARAIEGIKRFVFDEAAEQFFTKREYLGQTLFTFTPPGAPPDYNGFTYAIANRTLLLGVSSPAMVETALQNMAEKRDSFWTRADVRAALADVPEGAVDVHAQDFGLAVNMILGALVALPVPGGGSLVELTAAPDPARIARHWGLLSGYMVKEPKGLLSVIRIANPKP